MCCIIGLVFRSNAFAKQFPRVENGRLEKKNRVYLSIFYVTERFLRKHKFVLSYRLFCSASKYVIVFNFCGTKKQALRTDRTHLLSGSLVESKNRSTSIVIFAQYSRTPTLPMRESLTVLYLLEVFKISRTTCFLSFFSTTL